MANETRQTAIAFLRERTSAGGVFVEVGDEGPTMDSARFGLEVECMVREHVAPASDSELSTFVRRCVRSDGGYAFAPGDRRSSLAGSYYATRVAQLLARAELVDPGALRSYLRGALLGSDGQIRCDLDELYYGYRAWEISQAEADADLEAAIGEFLHRCESPGGGFGVLPDAPPHIERTYCAVQMLAGLADGDRSRGPAPETETWVTACFDDGIVYATPERATWGLNTLYWGARAAHTLQLELDFEAVAQRVSEQVRADGGLGVGAESTIWETYCGLRCLELFGNGTTDLR